MPKPARTAYGMPGDDVPHAGVDAGGAHAHEHLALAGLGRGHVAEHEHLGRSVAVLGEGLHVCLSVRVVEDVVERYAEHAGDLEGHLQRGRVAALLDGDDGLSGHAEAVGQVGLGHLAVREAQGPDAVGDLRRLHHWGIPRR